MSALILLSVVGLWLLICVTLALKIPGWLGAKRRAWLWSLLLFPVLALGPILDDLVGMHQFRVLCDERSAAWISPTWQEVKRAKRTEIKLTDLPASWITIHGHKTVYTDLDTGRAFMSFERFSTKGGRLNLVRFVGGENSCSRAHANRLGDQLSRMNINKLLEAGGSP